ncbi:MATE family efflux transporter [Luteitalea sp. TBR-22]|uniref:MATE family efflux transporter n=1 Tax=Luteitalea sp. TBR-22 TaxID=2802971 RepID=UPI001EF5DB45|nr:MATE family efflux transporter [Luteitalea sp. TBR-22]
MSPRGSFLRDAVQPMFRLAVPVIAAELGWMAMGVVDTLMVGPLGAAALSGTGIGSTLFIAIGIFGMGLLLGLDTVVSQAFGAGDRQECDRWLVSGVWLAVLSTPPLAALLWLVWWALPRMGFHPDVLPHVRAYFPIVATSLPPLLLYAALRRYLQALSRVGVIAFTLATANLVNVVVNWLLIYGIGPMPALGVRGAAWATVVSRLYMVTVLAWVTWQAHRGAAATHVSWRLPVARLRRLLALGLPAAAHLTFEVGVFSAVTTLAGQLTPPMQAAHHIALNVASVVFMVPLGVSAAAAVLVGQHVGRRDGPAARRAGWAAIVLVLTFMTSSAAAFFLAPAAIIGLYTREAAVIAIGSQLLGVAATFQLFDGLQVATTGALRGLGETRVPMLVSLVGYWVTGLPLAWWLCFRGGQGVIGLWLGLAVSLFMVGTALLVLWRVRIGEMLRRFPATEHATS